MIFRSIRVKGPEWSVFSREDEAIGNRGRASMAPSGKLPYRELSQIVFPAPPSRGRGMDRFMEILWGGLAERQGGDSPGKDLYFLKQP